MTKINREGAVGALLDIYEEAISAMKKVITDVSDQTLTTIINPNIAEDTFKTIQEILAHVVSSGYGYAVSINNLKGHNTKRSDKIFHLTIEQYLDDLTDVFRYTENVFKEIVDQDLEQFENSLKIMANWGQLYDIEQMMEHAIVHILRHKRQIEKIKHSISV